MEFTAYQQELLERLADGAQRQAVALEAIQKALDGAIEVRVVVADIEQHAIDSLLIVTEGK